MLFYEIIPFLFSCSRKLNSSILKLCWFVLNTARKALNVTNRCFALLFLQQMEAFSFFFPRRKCQQGCDPAMTSNCDSLLLSIKLLSLLCDLAIDCRYLWHQMYYCYTDTSIDILLLSILGFILYIFMLSKRINSSVLYHSNNARENFITFWVSFCHCLSLFGINNMNPSAISMEVENCTRWKYKSRFFYL